MPKESGAQRRKRQARERQSMQSMVGSMAKFVRHLPESELTKDSEQHKQQSQTDSCSEITVAAVENIQDESFSCLDSSISASENIENAKTHVSCLEQDELTTFPDCNSSEHVYFDDCQTLESSVNVPFCPPNYFIDAGHWPEVIEDSLKVQLIERGPSSVKNRNGPFPKNSHNRSFSCDWFYKMLKNHEKVERSWLLFSPLKNAVFCFPCRLFHNGKSSFGKVEGFSNWQKLNPKVDEHEKSPGHVQSFMEWKELDRRLQTQSTIDSVLQNERLIEYQNWREILKRILDCILFLAQQNLALRGHRESFDPNENNSGNFFQLMKLLAKYDPVTSFHMNRLTEMHSESQRVTYMSPLIQNEFISLLGNQVRSVILENIKKAKYYSILFDSTPDISHVDQMSQVIRYVNIDGDKVDVVESFIDFIKLEGKTAKEMTTEICNKLLADGLDIQNCYGQGYDNAATMAGHISGVQKRITNINPRAFFMPCNNHSLNLAGVHAAGTTTNSTTFFGTLERLYTFFSKSTHRWDVLTSSVPIKVKRLADTRWSSRHDAVSALAHQIDAIIDTLEKLRDGANETADTRSDAGCIIASLMSYSFFAYLYLWNPILKEINDAQLYLQKSGLALDMCHIKMDALAKFFSENRDTLVKEAKEKAQTSCRINNISWERRIRRRKQMPGENSGTDAGLTLLEEIEREQLETIDRLHFEIVRRTKQLKEYANRFGFLRVSVLLNANDKDEYVRNQIEHVCSVYPELNAEEMLVEIKRLQRHLASFQSATPELENEIRKWGVLELLQFIVKWCSVESFTNITILLRIFLTVAVSVATCERSFSKLKLIKSYLRSTMAQTRLSDLAILSIENGLSSKIDFEDIIDRFATEKSRKVKI